MIEDNYRHKGLRRKLVDELREKGITDARVLDAINKVPRHAFLTSAFVELAYENKALPIGAEQYRCFSKSIVRCGKGNEGLGNRNRFWLSELGIV